jgi:hypothetical protein
MKMQKFLIVFNLSLVLFLAIVFNSQGAEKEPQLSYSKAITYLENLDMNMAYKRLDIITKDFPKSEEARKAAIVKAVISATEFSSLDMLCTRYSEAVQKAKTDIVKKEISKMYMETSVKMVESGKALTNDVQNLLKYTDKPLNLEIKKAYDSLGLATKAFLSIKKLEEGELPSVEEIKMMEDFQNDISYRYVLGKILTDEDLIASRTIEGDVDWANAVMLMGNWLVNAGGINKAGWIDPSTKKITKSLVQAEKSFLTAKQCFEKARRLLKEPDAKAQAEARIKEIDKILKELGRGGK